MPTNYYTYNGGGWATTAWTTTNTTSTANNWVRYDTSWINKWITTPKKAIDKFKEDEITEDAILDLIKDDI